MSTNLSVPNPTPELIKVAENAKEASILLGQATNKQRCEVLIEMANALNDNADKILKANLVDIERSEKEGLNKSLLSRLQLTKNKLEGCIDGVLKVSNLADPIGNRQLHRKLDENLILERVTVPLGVLGVIFESRPDALIQIASLAVRSGNGALLKGGSEARATNQAIMDSLDIGLSKSNVGTGALSLLTTRQESLGLLHLNRFVNLIIPRGSNELVQFIQDNTRIPVLGHADGICHLYVDASVDIDKAISIALDSKIQYPAACNAIETLLIHEDVAEIFLKKSLPIFSNSGVTLKGDSKSQALGVKNPAIDLDWSTEYLDLILSIKIVSNVDEAIEHIRKYSSRHTEAIATNDKDVAEKFLRSVDSSGVYHNCSTRFADGFRYGFGAEVGISTQTLPPRGPVGLEGLVTYRYFLRGDSDLVKDFASGDRIFSHTDLPL
ncbi:glutamate-5-semialdehyde dehydrogenase [Prochlorococcus marinus]|uniref:Gamma-glutamyl phosphate reductase n=1 Tax=Prochlorococcus marinus XMU1408 TaxID=2213228 RepID=A0A318R564_PROMR|nr:glutamate-5-semialdehyde dehydrogenase [Prochlorococcus marinus]MBW3041616.1 glutamate-5-semialdehyde dehydrogenase [Prochlorococcus marinus str. XMU1408]PYE02772.1 glutamate-5-semialdehyde dehydrogenase [Prochlorococcus marinus XMU1408]